MQAEKLFAFITCYRDIFSQFMLPDSLAQKINTSQYTGYNLLG